MNRHRPLSINDFIFISLTHTKRWGKGQKIAHIHLYICFFVFKSLLFSHSVCLTIAFYSMLNCCYWKLMLRTAKFFSLSIVAVCWVLPYKFFFLSPRLLHTRVLLLLVEFKIKVKLTYCKLIKLICMYNLELTNDFH